MCMHTHKTVEVSFLLYLWIEVIVPGVKPNEDIQIEVCSAMLWVLSILLIVVTFPLSLLFCIGVSNLETNVDFSFNINNNNDNND